MLRWSYPLWKGEYIIIFTGSSSRNTYWKHGPWTNGTCIWNRLSISAPPKLQSKPAQQQGSGQHIHPEVEEAVLTVPGAPSPSLLTLAMDLYVLCFCKWLVVAVFLIFSLPHLCGRLQAAGNLKTRKESLDQCEGMNMNGGWSWVSCGDPCVCELKDFYLVVRTQSNCGDTKVRKSNISLLSVQTPPRPWSICLNFFTLQHM